MSEPEKKIQIDFNDEVEEKESNQLETEDIKNNIESTPETPIEESNENEVEETTESQSTDNYDVNEIFRFLSENGIVESGDELPEFESMNDVAKYIYDNNQSLINNEVKKELENYPQSYRDLFNYVKNGGAVEDFTNSYKDSYSSFDPLLLKGNIELQNKVMRDYYKSTTRWSDSIINTQLSKFNDDEIAKMSKMALGELKEFEHNRQLEIKQQQDARIAEQQKYTEQLLESYHTKLNELNAIGDIPLTINDKKSIEDNLFNNKTYDKLSSNFENYRMNLAILDSYGLLDDVSKLSSILKSKSSNKKYNFKKQSANTSDNKDFDINIIDSKHTGNQDDKLSFVF